MTERLTALSIIRNHKHPVLHYSRSSRNMSHTGRSDTISGRTTHAASTMLRAKCERECSKADLEAPASANAIISATALCLQLQHRVAPANVEKIEKERKRLRRRDKMALPLFTEGLTAPRKGIRLQKTGRTHRRVTRGRRYMARTAAACTRRTTTAGIRSGWEGYP